MSLDWNDLKFALAVARAGSLTGAAEALGVTHATVARRLSALEGALGATLFRRSRQGLSTTAAGEAIAARAAEIESRARRLRDAVAAAEAGPAGTVRLLSEQWVLDRLVAGGLAGLLAAHPRLALQTAVGGPRASLWRGEPGVGLWFEQRPQPSAFAIKLGAVPYAVYAAGGAAGEDARWVTHHDDEEPRSEPTRAEDRLRGPDGAVRLSAADPLTLREAVAAGLGRGLLPVCLAAADPRLARLGDAGPAAELRRDLYLHAHPDTLATPRVQALIGWIRSAALPALAGDDTGPVPR